MKSDTLFRFTALALLAILALGAWRVGANQMGHSQMAPPIVAVVDLERIVNNLDELTARQADLNNWITERQSAFDRVKQQFESARQKLEILPIGSDDAEQAREDLLRLQIELKLQQELSQEGVDQRKAIVHRDLFNKVSDAVERLARKNSYHLVLSNDSEPPLILGTESQVQRQIAGRRVLFADGALDITDELLQMMNNEWQAGAGN